MEFEKIIDQIAEASNAFFEGGPCFIHTLNCKNVQLSRETEIKDGKKIIIRSCGECGNHDAIEINVVQRVF